MPMELDDSLHKDFKRSSLHATFVQVAQDELNETPENYKKQLNLLQLCVANDKDLVIPDDHDFLIRFLRARKFDSQKAYHLLQRYFIMKVRYPELFKCPLPSDISKVLNFQAHIMLPNRDQFGRRVYIIRVDELDSSVVTIEDMFRINVLALEEVVREPETQIAGLVVILDLAGLSLHHARFFTPHYAKRTVEVVQETFPLRFKGFHIINEPFYFDAFMAVVKPFLKEKVRKRIHLHGSSLKTLHQLIRSDILPSEYGGTAGPFDNRPWHLKLLSDENYFRDLDTYGYKTGNTDK